MMSPMTIDLLFILAFIIFLAGFARIGSRRLPNHRTPNHAGLSAQIIGTAVVLGLVLFMQARWNNNPPWARKSSNGGPKKSSPNLLAKNDYMGWLLKIFQFYANGEKAQQGGLPKPKPSPAKPKRHISTFDRYTPWEYGIPLRWHVLARIFAIFVVAILDKAFPRIMQPVPLSQATVRQKVAAIQGEEMQLDSQEETLLASGNAYLSSASETDRPRRSLPAARGARIAPFARPTRMRPPRVGVCVNRSDRAWSNLRRTTVPSSPKIGYIFNIPSFDLPNESSSSEE